MTICANCSGSCCRLFNLVALTGADLIRLKTALQLPYQFFTKLVLVPKDQLEDLGTRSVMFSFRQEGIENTDKYIFLVYK